METNFKNLDDLKDRKPFRVPDGYFDTFTEKMMSRLPEKGFVEEEHKTISLYDRVKPWLYMAASFIGMVVIFSLIYKATKTTEQEDTAAVVNAAPKDISSSDEDADFLECIEEMYADKYASYYYLDDML